MDIQAIQFDCMRMDFLIEKGGLAEISEFISLIKDKVYQDSSLQAHHYYVLGNGCSALVNDALDGWSNDSAGQAVRYYKRATYESGFNDLSADVKSRIYTNLGSELCRQGRVLEGVEQLDYGLRLFDNPVAYLVKGKYLLNFSCQLFDEGHAAYFQKESYFILKYVVECRFQLFDQGHLQQLESDIHIAGFVKWFDENYSERCEGYPHLSSLKGRKGHTRKEKEYVRWCLENRLFINELNDISVEPVVGFDALSFPGVACLINPLMTMSETLALSAAFSEIKYQYAFSRFNYFDAVTSVYARTEVNHYADLELGLTDSLDYCVYRRDIEMVKLSFKSLYSCFDKIAVLMSMYLGHDNATKAHFSSVWYHKNDSGRKVRVRDELQSLNNPFLLALYWLSREINDSEEEGHGYWMDSNAGRMADIRNKMEHGGFRVVIDGLHNIGRKYDEARACEGVDGLLERLEENRLLCQGEESLELRQEIQRLIELDETRIAEKEKLKGYPLIVTDVELREQTLRLMKKVRFAIIYLALAVNYEESKRDGDGIVLPMGTPIY